MAEEVLRALSPGKGQIVVDGTIGEGGHAVRIAELMELSGRLIGIDADSANAEIAAERLKDFNIRTDIFNDSYLNIKKIIKELGIKKVDAVLLDLGFSSRQIKASKRGFSFTGEEPLDMRYNVKNNIPAAEWINNAACSDIAGVLKKYGQEGESNYIAKKIIEYRRGTPIKTNRQLTDIVTLAKRKQKPGTHPATKTFQAIRIFINKELENLEEGIINCLDSIKKGGRLAVLTYHSLEDRKVKEVFRQYAGCCHCPPDFPVCTCGAMDIRPKISILKESGQRPSEKEIKTNPPSRSAHLRLCRIEESSE